MNILHINTEGEVHIKRGDTWLYLALPSDELTSDDVQLIEQVWTCQEINDARYRVYYSTEQGLTLETEFVAFLDQTDFWAELDRIATENSLTIETIYEDPHDGRIEHQVALQKRVPLDRDRARAEKFRLEVLTQSLWDQQGMGVI